MKKTSSLLHATSLALLLALAPAAAFASCTTEDDCGNDAWSIYLPNAEGTPAPNIELANFQHMNPDGLHVEGVMHEELMRLHDAVKPLAAAAFADSGTTFEVMVRYTLTPDQPAVFEMQTTGGESDHAMLTKFHASASSLTDFHSTSPVAYALFHYKITPATPDTAHAD